MTDSLFTQVDDAVFLPTEYSRGPWSAESLHGGPVAALMAQLAEDVLDETGQPAHVPVRLTLDLERPVLLAPVRARAEIVRPGRKVQVAEVTLHDEQDRRLARASVLAIRRHRVELPQIEQDEPLPPARTGGTRIPT